VRAEDAERPGAGVRGVHVADDGERDRDHRAATDRGQHPADEERRERVAERDHDRADEEDEVCRQERSSTADDVADPAGDRHDRDERDEVGVDDPRCVVESVGEGQSEVADDRPQHRRDDGEVVGGDEDAEADDGEDRPRRGRTRAPRRDVSHRRQPSTSGASISNSSP
jgi:hypothetical protein